MERVGSIVLALCLAVPCSAQWQVGQRNFTHASGTPQVATPTFSPTAGSYSSTQTVTISTVTSPAVLCYTTDGSTPTESGNLCSGGTTSTYSSPISVATTQTVKAIGTRATYTDSAVASALYTIGGVTFDAVGPSSSGATATAGSSSWTTFTDTWTHVTASGAYLFVGCGFGEGVTSIATISATYNGTALTSLGSVEPNNDPTQGIVYLFYSAAPTSGSHSVVATATYVSGTKASNDGLICGSVSFTGATGVGTAVTAHGSGTAVSSGAVTSATGHMVLGVVGTGTAIGSSSQTLRWKAALTGLGLDAAGQSSAAGASSVTMGYTVTSDAWGIVAVDVQ
jgi:hypothetical protein